MVKFLIDTENMDIIKDKLKIIDNDFCNFSSELSGISLKDDEFDFKGAINSIIGNTEICSQKINTAINNINEIVNTHTQIQNSNNLELANNFNNSCNYNTDTIQNNGKYVVKKGDTLSHIAQKYNLTVDDIAKANNIKNVNLIITGTVLNIPNTKNKKKEEKIEVLNVNTKMNDKEQQENNNQNNYTYKSVGNFKVTTDNKKYNMSSEEYNVLCAIVAAECDKSSDDALAVISVILNRCENSAWINSHGTSPYKQATAKNQFVVFQEGYYKKYLGDNCPKNVKQAVSDACNGIRNNKFLSFRSNSSTGYSNNLITTSGNRYK